MGGRADRRQLLGPLYLLPQFSEHLERDVGPQLGDLFLLLIVRVMRNYTRSAPMPSCYNRHIPTGLQNRWFCSIPAGTQRLKAGQLVQNEAR